MYNIQIKPPLKYTPTIIKEISLLYPLAKLKLNMETNLCAFGMIEGSVMIYDINLLTEKHYLDKHKERVSSLDWSDNWTLISGGNDG